MGTDFFTNLGNNPAEAGLFSLAMSSMSDQLNRDLVKALDTADSTVAVDVGGGTGALVQGLLLANRACADTVRTCPTLLRGAQAAAEKQGLADRFTAVAGDFFESVPPADLHRLKMVLHDWSDAECVKVLRDRRALCRSPVARTTPVRAAPHLPPVSATETDRSSSVRRVRLTRPFAQPIE